MKKCTLLITTVLIVLLLNFRLYKVEGDSMSPSYSDGDVVLTKTIWFQPDINNLLNKTVVLYVDTLDINSLLIKQVTDINPINNTVYISSLNTNGDYLDSEELGYIPINKVKGLVIS